MKVKVKLDVDPAEIKYDKYIVASIDMLGIKQALDTDKDVLDKIYATYHLFERILNERSARSNIELKVQYKSFSDNIVICVKYTDEISDNIVQKVFFDAVIVFIGCCTGIHGLLVRGGIAIGELYFDDNFVIGNALVDAYKLESELAIFPRIIIDRKSYQELSNGYQDWFKKDVDYCFLDYLNKCNLFDNTTIIKMFNPENKTGAEIFKGVLLDNICSNKSREKVLQKIMWLINYFNDCCDENSYGEMKITDEDISRCLAGES